MIKTFIRTLIQTLARTFIGIIYLHTHTHRGTSSVFSDFYSIRLVYTFQRICQTANNKKKKKNESHATTTTTTRRTFFLFCNLHEFTAEAKPNAKWISGSLLIPIMKLNMNKPHLLGLFLLCLITATAGDVQRRQVVAPLWLQQHGPLARTQNAQVRVTPLNLKETALIRANIQRAVNDGTYVVAASPQQVSPSDTPYRGHI